ncbi:MAG: NAD(P)/FAD-dependent oxidoreductase [Chitinophagaceae bacterium]
MKYDVIIVGAGAAGLMAMKYLLDAGCSVCMLEAAGMPGGRMITVSEPGFDGPVETGAEFVHGDLPLTLALLDEAGVPYTPVDGKMIMVENERGKKSELHDKHWEACMQALDELSTDMTIAAFLQTYFPGPEYESLRRSVQHYAEGYDLADINRASARAAGHEWNQVAENQYRVTGGYSQLVDYLAAKCARENAGIHYDSAVTHIHYKEDYVRVETINQVQFIASKLLLTVSAGVLKSGAITFVPALEARYRLAIGQLGFGTVIKVLLQFKKPFWKRNDIETGFILSDEAIPTWWTQFPADSNLLTGWLGGPPSIDRSGDTDEVLLASALTSLSAIFHLTVDELRNELQHHKIICWHRHAHVKGGYSFITVDTSNARKVLWQPAGNAIFFAGEALYAGASQGTVEAALQSGREAASAVINMLQENRE